MRNIIILIFLLSAVFACSQSIDENRMYGTYKWNKGNENMALSLEHDHTNRYGLVNDSTGQFGIVGTWEFRSINNELVLRNFQFLNGDGRSEFPRGNWFSQVKEFEGEIRLIYSSENELFFLKNP